MCLKYILRTQRLIRPVLALDKDRSGLQALGVVPLADGNAEAGAVSDIDLEYIARKYCSREFHLFDYFCIFEKFKR